MILLKKHLTIWRADDKNVGYKGKRFTLSALTSLSLGKNSSAGIGGLRYFKYKGEWLKDIRTRQGQ